MAKATAKSRKISITFKGVRAVAFWVAIPVFVLTAYFIMGKAKTAIKTEYDSKTKMFTSEKSSADKIASDSKHPNDETVKAIAAEKETLSKNVYNAWMLMYKEQKSRNRWPRELSKEFLDIVENAKFRDPIGVGKPYILEDYAYFMANNLPELIKNSNRRRCQVRDYRYVENRQEPEKSRFEPVYVEPKDGLLYVISDQTVYIYNERENFMTKVEESDLRDYLLGLPDKKPYYREMDPMIANPRQFIAGGAGRGSAGGASMGGGTRGLGGGMPAPSVSPMGTGAGSGRSVPGYGVDPALEQVSGQSGIGNRNNASGEAYPGLPPYQERSRIVGNIDWLSPEIFGLVRWGANEIPLSIEVWYLQEDLWIYDSIISVLVETNRLKINKPDSEKTDEDLKKEEEAKNNINLSPIKCIEQMLIGKDAASAWSTIRGLAIGGANADAGATAGSPGVGGAGPGLGKATAASDDAGPGMGPGMGNVGKPGNAPGAQGGGKSEESALEAILNGRYLDAKDAPLAASASPPYAEFNRMPVVLRLVVDQRRIPDILVNCANSPMPIDVRHVRICPENAKSVSLSGGGASGSPASSRTLGGSGASGQAGGVSVGRTGNAEMTEYGPDAIHIEIYGIICIYNEPNPELFGTGIAEEESAESTADAAEGAEAEEGTASEEGANPQGGPAEEGAEAGEDSAGETPASATGGTGNESAPGSSDASDASAAGDSASAQDAPANNP